MKLEIGYNFSFEVRKEVCIRPGIEDISILFISDLHLNKFNQKTINIILSTIEDLQPTIILLGGDYVDSEFGLQILDNFLAQISDRPNVFAIAGNHDYFFDITSIEKLFVKNKICWIEKMSVEIEISEKKIKIDGNIATEKQSHCDFSILVLHKPLDIENIKDNYDIMLAGHLHGCQFVFWQKDEKLYPGKLFYKWNVLKEEGLNYNYYISKGMGDTLPIRYNCKRDMIFINVKGKY